MKAGKLYDPLNVGDGAWEKSRASLDKFNSLPYERHSEGMDALREVFGKLPKDAYITPPFYCDRGFDIFIGKNFYANTGLIILDHADVIIGDNVFIAPRVSIFTATHPIDAGVRATGLEYAKPVTIGNDVWIGGGVIINPGVTVGDNVVIGSGAVVTKDIPSGVIAAGNPCRIIREITPEDKAFWEKEAEEYYREK